jgi:hypothetical protein
MKRNRQKEQRAPQQTPLIPAKAGIPVFANNELGFRLRGDEWQMWTCGR